MGCKPPIMKRKAKVKLMQKMIDRPVSKKKRSDQTFKLIAHADDRDRGRATASEVGGTGSNLLRRINNRHDCNAVIVLATGASFTYWGTDIEILEFTLEENGPRLSKV